MLCTCHHRLPVFRDLLQWLKLSSTCSAPCGPKMNTGIISAGPSRCSRSTSAKCGSQKSDHNTYSNAYSFNSCAFYVMSNVTVKSYNSICISCIFYNFSTYILCHGFRILILTQIKLHFFCTLLVTTSISKMRSLVNFC
jgi:hypothetical protein